MQQEFMEWMECRSSQIHGTGAFAIRDIPEGTRVVEYVGERISKAESLNRCEANNQFIFSLTETEDLDGGVSWNLARFLNHSCAPNCEALVIEGRIWLIAKRDIARGEEVTFNYGFDLEEYSDYPCHCGAKSCVGFIVAEEFFPHVRQQRQVRQHSSFEFLKKPTANSKQCSAND